MALDYIQLLICLDDSCSISKLCHKNKSISIVYIYIIIYTHTYLYTDRLDKANMKHLEFRTDSFLRVSDPAGRRDSRPFLTSPRDFPTFCKSLHTPRTEAIAGQEIQESTVENQIEQRFGIPPLWKPPPLDIHFSYKRNTCLSHVPILEMFNIRSLAISKSLKVVCI